MTLGVTASMQALEQLLREGRAEFREGEASQNLDAAPAAAAGEIRRRPHVRHQIRIRSEGRPAAGDRGSGRRRAAQRPHPGAARRHRLRQDLHHGQGDRSRRSARPSILAPNKTLAAQLYGEFRNFFPDNAVEYFVSYYDYYQPEAYIPRTDTYIEKDSSINEQIDRMRHSATRALLERDDVIIVASVSCIYGIGSVETYSAMTFTIKRGEKLNQRQLLADLVALQYKRSGGDFYRGSFRVRGDVIEIFPAHYGRPRLARVAVRRRGGIDPRIRSAHRAEDRRAGIRQNLRQFALRDAAADAVAGDFRHQVRTAPAARTAQCRRPAARSAAARAAHASTISK